jgi:hypothetical protein
MPEESYTLSQRFGCVKQLGNLYFPGDGCPAHAPVVHTGIDMAAPEGTVFYAAASGWVTLADWDRPTADANTRIIIQHDGRNADYATDYLHWIASYVEEGDYVRAGQPIGEVGSVGYSTGPHLHFSVTDLRSGEHIDPVRWLPRDSTTHDYTGRRPGAKMRLPAGTTAGQPESADPEPPAPAKRAKVPDSPPSDSGGKGRHGRDGKAGKHDKGRKDAGTQPDETGQASPEGQNETAGTTTKSGKDRDRTRTEERKKDGQREESTASGEEPPAAEEPAATDKRKNGKNGSDPGNSGKDGATDRGNQDNNGDRKNGGKSNEGNNNGAGGKDGSGNDGGNGDKPGNGGNGGHNGNRGGSHYGSNSDKGGNGNGGNDGKGDRSNGRLTLDAVPDKADGDPAATETETETTMADEPAPAVGNDELVPA